MVEKIGTEALNDAQKLKAKVEEIFKEFDKDGSRGIDENELRQGMKELGITLNDEEVKTMLTLALTVLHVRMLPLRWLSFSSCKPEKIK